MSKPRVIKDYDKLTLEVIEQIKLVYPQGFTNHLVSFTNRNGEIRKGLPFETEDFYYLIRMSVAKAEEIVENDEDYDENGKLTSEAKTKYEFKHDDEDFLNELNSNSDNDLGSDIEAK